MISRSGAFRVFKDRICAFGPPGHFMVRMTWAEKSAILGAQDGFSH